ncbi:MAG TPA: sigma-70 family RNA polymerase sigma factor [Gemmata sp.]|nr:sigma-70 family RNA polymerase sigma factor [Gemmata sp.]
MPPTTIPGLRRVAAGLNPDTSPDGELLARFLDHRDEAAFAELVRRHAAMVFGTCRRVLGNAPDADDAFQAAFVVLVRRAHGLTGRATVGNFLYGVAFHTALKAKAMAAKRRTREARSNPAEPRPDQSELLAALDEELARLPEKYREPVVLCELEGRPRRDAAEVLGVAEGTISSRLATAHRMLEKRPLSRGFGAVAVAALLGGQRPAVADSLAHAVVTSALGCPPAAVSRLASEVTKMMFLHKLGIGAAVLSAVVAVALAGGAEPPRPAADDPPNLAKPDRPKAAPAPEPAWKAEFRKVYGLKDGEVLRRVAPPYPDCRAEYFRDRLREFYKRSKLEPSEEAINKDYSDHFTRFGWKDGWPVDGQISQTVPVKPEEGVQLRRVLDLTTGFQLSRLDADAELLETKVTGDWVVRAGADPEKLVAALEPILRKECGLKVSLAVKRVEREAYVLAGRYEAKPLPDRKANLIEVFGTELTDRNTGGGGSGDLREMAEHVEGWVEFSVVLGEVENAPKSVSWHYNYRSPFTKEQHAEDKDPAAVLQNIALQTGLTVKKEKRPIAVLAVTRAD